MNREQLHRILEIARRLDTQILIIGSQSILGSYSEDRLPDAAVGSVEVDVAYLSDPDAHKADMLDGAIGEMSEFYEQYGVYAQGVEVRTATLPAEWGSRIVLFDEAWFLEPHDLVISKLVAGRPKDFEFAQALIDAGLISVRTLFDRAQVVEWHADTAPGASERLVSNVQGLDRGRGIEL